MSRMKYVEKENLKDDEYKEGGIIFYSGYDCSSEMGLTHGALTVNDYDFARDYGYPNKWQLLSLDSTKVNGKPGCISRGTVQHETLHALGVDHEQSRPDRDQHIKIKWGNIQKDMDSQFLILDKKGEGKDNPEQEYNWLDSGFKFELESVMMYGPYSFAKEPKVLGQATMLKQKGKTVYKTNEELSRSEKEGEEQGLLGE